jgi:hypothetical protein
MPRLPEKPAKVYRTKRPLADTSVLIYVLLRNTQP